MSKAAASATSRASRITPAATAIAPSVRTRNGPNGWKAARPNCCRWNTSMWSSPCPNRLPQSLSTSPWWSTTFCSAPLPKLCSPSQAIPNTSAVSSAFSPCCTPGDRHLHCVVPGGGLSPDHQRWIACRPGFFLPVRVLSRLFRRRFLEALQQAFATGKLRFFGELEALRDATSFTHYLAPPRQTEWVVYAKPPFGGPAQVLAYLGRYTHRVAISNRRLLARHD